MCVRDDKGKAREDANESQREQNEDLPGFKSFNQVVVAHLVMINENDLYDCVRERKKGFCVEVGGK